MSNPAATPPPSGAPRRSGREVDELVRAHLPIVGYQVSEIMMRLPGHVLRDDMVSAGMAALAQAAIAYDATTGVPFSRYATRRIRGALLDELRGMDWAPRGARSRSRQLATVEEALAVQMGRRPDRSELAAAMGCSPEDVDAAREATQRAVVSIDASDGIIADVLPHRGPGPEEQLLQDEQVRYLNAAIESLPARLRTVVEALFLQDRSTAEVAAEMGVTESRISQLRTEALGLMRDGMNAALEPALVVPAERPGGVVDRRRQAYFAAVAAHAAAMPVAVLPASASLPETASLPATGDAVVRGPEPAVEPGSWAALA